MHPAKRLLLIGGDTHYGRQVIRGVDEYCRVHGRWEYHLEEDSNSKTVEHAEAAVRQWKADGIIAHIRSNHVLWLVRNSGLPAVNVAGGREVDLPTVRSDSVASGEMGARHFLDNSFRNFAFCAKTVESFSERICEGFLGHLRNAGFDCGVLVHPYVGRSDRNWVKNRRKMKQWLESLKKPVAVMCPYDALGQQVTSACKQLGLRVPDDVAILGVGNAEFFCQMCTPQLSSVDIDAKQIGYEAAKLLDRMLHGAKAPQKPVLVAPRCVVARQSSDIITLDDSDVVAAVRFIRDHAGEPFNVKELMQQVPISRRLLELRFRKLIGRTPREEIMRVRMERATSLLRETDLQMPMVARRCGFVGRVVFSTFFRRTMGMTPTQYRRRFQLHGSS